MPRWKREQYMDASGAWRMPGERYVDYSGAWRSPDEPYVDITGAWRQPNEEYVDGGIRESNTWIIPAAGAINQRERRTADWVRLI